MKREEILEILHETERDWAVQTVKFQLHRQFLGICEHWQDFGKGRISASWKTTELAEQLKSPMKCNCSKCYKRRIQANIFNWNSLDVSQAYDFMN